MARIRTIKPEFPQSESMGRISRDARLAFVLMWPHCDDAGRLRASSRALASLLFPFDDDAPKLISKWLDELERERCITRYEIDGNHYLQVENFLKHQKIDHPSKSNIPEPREPSRELGEASRNVALDQGKERIGPRTKERDHSRAARFEEFWSACPKRVGKGKVEGLFTKIVGEGVDAELLITSMGQYAKSQVGKDATYIAHPSTWLSQQRWLDEISPGVPTATIHILSDEMKRQEQENLKRMGVI